MRFRDNLTKIVCASILTITGCVEEKEKVNTFKDINGDGKPDMVYCVQKGTAILQPNEYRVYVKYNLGENKFGKPKLIAEGNNRPEDIPVLKIVSKWDELGGEYKQ